MLKSLTTLFGLFLSVMIRATRLLKVLLQSWVSVRAVQQRRGDQGFGRGCRLPQSAWSGGKTTDGKEAAEVLSISPNPTAQKQEPKTNTASDAPRGTKSPASQERALRQGLPSTGPRGCMYGVPSINVESQIGNRSAPLVAVPRIRYAHRRRMRYRSTWIFPLGKDNHRGEGSRIRNTAIRIGRTLPGEKPC